MLRVRVKTPLEMLTIPVSADRCWDWKKTASFSAHFGHRLFDRGSCEDITSAKVQETVASTKLCSMTR